MRVGTLVKIRESFSRKRIGKLAIVIGIQHAHRVTVQIIDTEEIEPFPVRKLEIICE